MSYKPWSLIACAVVGLLPAVARPAYALSCEAPGVSAPAWDYKSIPTNTLVWCPRWIDQGASAVQLKDARGELVSGTQTLITAPNFRLSVFRPDAELAPNSVYYFDCGQYPGAEPTPFMTGAGPRHQAPGLPRLDEMKVAAVADTGWGESLHASFAGISPADTIVVLDFEGGEALNTAALTGSLQDARYLYGEGGMAFVGRGPCISNWPEAKLGASKRLRFGAFDVTGAFSGWTDWKTVTLPSEFEDVPKEPVPAPDVLLPERASASEELAGAEPSGDGRYGEQQAPAANATSINDVVGDLAHDDVAAPSRQSSGCQLGASAGSGSGAGWFAAFALLVLRRKRHGSART